MCKIQQKQMVFDMCVNEFEPDSTSIKKNHISNETIDFDWCYQ